MCKLIDNNSMDNFLMVRRAIDVSLIDELEL